MPASLHQLNTLRDRLASLPEFAPPPGTWDLIQQRLDQERLQPEARHLTHWPMRAVAAVLLPLFVVTVFSLLREATAPGRPSPDSVDQLVSRSQQLEAMLQQLPRRPAVERAATSATIDALQTRIQLLDMELSSAGGSSNRNEAQQLWNERIQLMNSLFGMRYAEAVRVGYQTATQDGAL